MKKVLIVLLSFFVFNLNPSFAQDDTDVDDIHVIETDEQVERDEDILVEETEDEESETEEYEDE